MTGDDLAVKKSRVGAMEDTRMEDEELLLAANSILALFRPAIREECVAKKEDMVALESRVDRKLASSK